ncbi:MAG: matrixin family metalloprotease [Planctomycetota bacterium]|jgi:hypothetical protein
MRYSMTLITLAAVGVLAGAGLARGQADAPHTYPQLGEVESLPEWMALATQGQALGTIREIHDLVRAMSPEVPVSPTVHTNVLQAPVGVCFAPGTPDDVIARVQEAIFPPRGDGSRYYVGSSWSGIGEPTTLTWSLVPDGLYAAGRVGEAGGGSVLFSRMDSLFGGRLPWINLIQSCFERWGELSGIEYVWVTDPPFDWDDGASWGSPGGATRGDIRIAAHEIDGDSGVLAYNFFPQNGDMVLDAAEAWNDPLDVFRFLRNIVMHEHGHGLGLYHSCPVAFSKLMEPFLATNFDGPQHDDIRGAQRQHGDPFEPDNTFADANDLGYVPVGSPMVLGEVPSPSVAFGSTLSIDQDGEEDWFRFSLDGLRVVTLTLAPIGLVYANGPQSCNGCCPGDPLDSATIANLNLQLLGSDGSTIIDTADVQPAGQPESLTRVNLAGPNEYFIRICESDSPSGSQLYTLEIMVNPTNPPAPAPSPHDALKNRYISFDPDNYEAVAFQVELIESAEFPGATGTKGWVSEPDENDVSRLADSPYYTDAWPDVVHVGDCAVVPVATYEIRASVDGIALTEALEVATIHKPGTKHYGDVVGNGTGDYPPLPGFTPPNGVVNVTDVQAVLLSIQGPLSPSAHTTWVDLHGLGDGVPPNFILNVSDLQRVLWGIDGQQYLDSPEHLDPGDCP